MMIDVEVKVGAELKDAINIADVLQREGKPADALAHLHAVKGLFDEADCLYLAKYNLYAGLSYKDLGNQRKAISYYESALPLYREANATKQVGLTLNNIGNAYIELGEYDEAQKYLSDAARILKRVEDQTEYAQCLECCARLLLWTGVFTEAVNLSSESVKILSKGIEFTPLDESVKTFNLCVESLKVKNALETCGGHIPSAARMLGLKKPQCLRWKLGKQLPWLNREPYVVKRAKK